MRIENTSLSTIADVLSARIRLARAAELASINRYLLAEGVLCPSGRTPKTQEEIDMLARIKFYQGDLVSSKKLWELANHNSNKYDCEIDIVHKLTERIKFTQKWTYRSSLYLVVISAVLLSGYFIYTKVAEYRSKKAALDNVQLSTRATSQSSPAPTPIKFPAKATETKQAVIQRVEKTSEKK
jgi:hypothetical protein